MKLIDRACILHSSQCDEFDLNTLATSKETCSMLGKVSGVPVYTLVYWCDIVATSLVRSYCALETAKME